MANEVWEYIMDGTESVQLLDYLGNPANAKGLLTEFSPPEITKSFDTDQRLGERGVNPRPMTIEEMSSSLTLKGISVEFANAVAIAFGASKRISIVLSGVARSRYSDSTTNMVTTVKGHLKKLPVPMFKANEVSELSMELSPTYYSQVLGSFSLVVDLDLNKFEVNGVNQWS